MARGLKLTWASSRYILGQDDGIRVRITASCPSEVSAKIFAYRMLPVTPDGQSAGHYSHVCSPVDLEEYPEDAPIAGSSPEWFRLDYVDVLVRSTKEADNFVEIVREDVNRLIASLKRMDTLFFTGEELVGDPLCSSSSSASTGSL